MPIRLAFVVCLPGTCVLPPQSFLRRHTHDRSTTGAGMWTGKLTLALHIWGLFQGGYRLYFTGTPKTLLRSCPTYIEFACPRHHSHGHGEVVLKIYRKHYSMKHVCTSSMTGLPGHTTWTIRNSSRSSSRRREREGVPDAQLHQTFAGCHGVLVGQAPKMGPESTCVTTSLDVAWPTSMRRADELSV